ncbi:TPA: hypothetical protein DIV45_02145 [Patescibacteria group bacterium]|nr:hypothetical protein [Patescibacteria group bacterium]
MIAPNNKKEELCRECDGQPGAILPDALECGIVTCFWCNGTGFEPKDRQNECPYCEGSGKDPANTFAGPSADGRCPWCLGMGERSAPQIELKGGERCLGMFPLLC